MRIVLDTNVVVSGLISVKGPPAEILRRLQYREVTVLYDARICAEYREVLKRPRFKLDALMVESFVSLFELNGERIEAQPVGYRLPDPADQPFLEVAMAGQAEAIVTGNLRHFPEACGVRVLSPAAWVALLAG